MTVVASAKHQKATSASSAIVFSDAAASLFLLHFTTLLTKYRKTPLYSVLASMLPLSNLRVVPEEKKYTAELLLHADTKMTPLKGGKIPKSLQLHPTAVSAAVLQMIQLSAIVIPRDQVTLAPNFFCISEGGASFLVATCNTHGVGVQVLYVWRWLCGV